MGKRGAGVHNQETEATKKYVQTRKYKEKVVSCGEAKREGGIRKNSLKFIMSWANSNLRPIANFDNVVAANHLVTLSDARVSCN